ncbi:MAG TPA: helix-turn-helix transcriptional regulator [Chlamydiales bacterium]|nr:helix-turn-helix transcriptional regulator [Chlamydiales bacterium]
MNTIPWRELASESIEKYSEPGHMVRAGRYKADLTQQELADLLGILPHHISEMEHGKRPIGKNMAKALGKALKIDYRVFL